LLIGAVLAFYYDGYCLVLRRRLYRHIVKAFADICWWLTSFVAVVSFWLLMISQGPRLSVFVYILLGVVIYRMTVRQYILRWYVIRHRSHKRPSIGRKPVNNNHNNKNNDNKNNDNKNNASKISNLEMIFDRPALAVWRSKKRAGIASETFRYKIRLNFFKYIVTPFEKKKKL